jgi:transposase
MITEQVIRPLFEQGMRNKDIQELLNVSSYVVSHWRKKLGFPRTFKYNEPRDYDWHAIQEDHTNGMTEQGIMKKYGISSRTIWLAKKDGRLIPRPYQRKWRTYKQIRATVNEANARYRARIKAQVVPGEDIQPIQDFYANCPEGYEVDHIIPLSKGGLHSLPNLQYLTVSENRRKSNKIVGG